MNNEQHLTYDEEQAIKFIKKCVPAELNNKLNDNYINNIIDKVYNYYDECGMFDDNADETALINIDEEELILYVVEAIKKEKKLSQFTPEEISSVIEAELAYCDSIGVFE